MLFDARRLASGEVIDADLCVIGGGPAGIAIAREFVGTSTRVCLLESGGLSFEPRDQELSDGTNHGTELSSLRNMRRRQLGGNSNAWNIMIREQEGETPPQLGVRYAPLDEFDFEARPWIPHSGWPIRRRELDPFYERAHRICGMGPYSYAGEDWEERSAPRLPFDAARVVSNVFRFGPREVFYDTHRRTLEAAENVQVYHHATALELSLDDSGQRVASVKIASVPGHHVFVRAKQFALCLGGMENARMLLLSNRTHAAGIGNAHGMVGRYFMDHPLIDTGSFVPARRDLFARMYLYDLRVVRDTPVMGRLSLSQEVMRREQLLNATAYLYPRPSERRAQAVHAVGLLKDRLAARKRPKLRNALEVLAGADYVLYAAWLQRSAGQAVLHGFARGGWSKLPEHLKRFDSFRVLLQTEQRPDANNRIWLGEQRDRFGLRKLEVHWQWSDEDRRRIARTQEIFAREFARAELGALHLERAADGLPNLHVPAGLAHHMGTTRMHREPTQGVVDENCRVHGVHNLFVAGSSVFPTGGYANPTLTVIALAARLADHLRRSS